MAQKPETTTIESETKASRRSSFGSFVSAASKWTKDTAQAASKAVASAANTVGHSVVEPKLSPEEVSLNLKKQQEEKEKNAEDMKWFDDIVDGSESSRGNTQILSSIWKQITGENITSRIMSSKQRTSAKIWGKLCHRCDISYPDKSKLKVIDMFNDDNIRLVNDVKYAVRHAIASYPPAFIVFLGLKTDVSFALKSTKKLLVACFDGIEIKDIVIDNCSKNLIIQNSTHQPSFYLAVDHKYKKIIISIRGSSSISDAFTDINAECKPYSSHGINGFVHEGIMAATKFVFDSVTIDLVKLCNLYKEYQCIITGHSLGGGVSACLGLMYYDHPVIYKQNKLRIYPFASPCVVSKEFIDNKIYEDYIYTVALSTDLVTRLSLESLKHSNLRLDCIEKADKNAIRGCMTNLKDDQDPNNDSSAALLKQLKEIKCKNPKERLYPIGNVLWFVPKEVMDNNIERRRRCLMCIKENIKTTTTTTDNDDNNDDQKDYKMSSAKSNTISDIFSSTWDNFNKGMQEFQETMDSSILNSGGSKYAKQYDGSHYILCEATECREVFQEMVLDLPESLYAHMPSRYLWACDAHLTRGNLNDE